ncbi:MAG: hypothetical protein JST89_22385 [Cyanobacteria bacterium SZAS-4]|nr:hypothetical protein [Cyanobacteria bacterium SZAS-4]
MAENVSLATGFYLAMARTQCLDGQGAHAEATLDCVWDYHKRFSNADKLSVIRIVCNILQEQNLDGTSSLITEERIRSRFLRMSVALAGQLSEDKVSQVEALAQIKRSTNEDLIEATVQKKQIASLAKFIDHYRSKLFEEFTASLKANTEFKNHDLRQDDLSGIFAQVDRLGPDIHVFLILTKLAHNLLSANLQFESVAVCAYIRNYCLRLPRTKLSLKNNTSIAEIFEKALSDPDGVNSFVLDTTLKELKLQKYLTARKNVATETFEEHFLSWSKGLGANAFGFTAPESTANQEYVDQSMDLVIAHTLNYLADQLIHNNELEEACACSQLAVLTRIQAQRIDQRDVEDLSVIAASMLTTKQYEKALKWLSDIRSTLKFSSYNAIWCQRLSTYATLLEHLFSQLANEDSKLSIKSSSTISYVMVLYSRIGSLPQFDQLLNTVLELITRTEKSTLADVLKTFWKELNRLPVRKVVQDYIESLVRFTEDSIDRSCANACYLEFLENLYNREFKIKFFIPLLEKIIDERELDGNEDSLTELPLVAALTMLYLEEGEIDRCKIPCEALRSLGANVINTAPNNMLKQQCIKAFFKFENVFLTLTKRDPHSFAFLQSSEVGSIISEIIQVNATAPDSRQELCYTLCDFLGTFISEGLSTPKTLLDAVEYFDSDLLVKTIEKLESKYGHSVLAQLLHEVTLAKSIDGGTSKVERTFIIPLLLMKTKYLQKSGKFKEVDDIYLQIISLEKLAIEDSSSAPGNENISSTIASFEEISEAPNKIDRVFNAQTDFLYHLIKRREFVLAFDLAFEMITKSTNVFDNLKASVLFDTIDNFVVHDRYSDSIELMLALVSRVQTLKFDQKMLKTFDLVLLSCLHQNMFDKAQLLLNRAKNLTRAENKDAPEQNFIRAAADRYTNAFPDREAFRFDKLNAALDHLREKKVFCNDLELFVAIVFQLLETDISYPDDNAPHSPPD